MNNPSNPFIYDRPLDSEKDELVYISYERDIHNLLDILKNKPYVYFISPLKSGTTTFFNALSSYIIRNSLSYQPIKIDLRNLSMNGDETFETRLSIEILNSLGIDHSKVKQTLSDTLIGISKAQSISYPLLLLLDESESLSKELRLEAIKSISQLIQSIEKKTLPFYVVFTIHPTFRDSSDPNTPIGQLLKLEGFSLTQFSKEDIWSHLVDKVFSEYNVDIDLNTWEHVYSQIGSNLYILQYILSQVFSGLSERENKKITREYIERYISPIPEEDLTVFINLCNSIQENEQLVNTIITFLKKGELNDFDIFRLKTLGLPQKKDEVIPILQKILEKKFNEKELAEYYYENENWIRSIEFFEIVLRTDFSYKTSKRGLDNSERDECYKKLISACERAAKEQPSEYQRYIEYTKQYLELNLDYSGRLSYIEEEFIPAILNAFKQIHPRNTDAILNLFLDSLSIISNIPRIRLYLTAQKHTVLKCRAAIGDKAEFFLKEHGGVNLEETLDEKWLIKTCFIEGDQDVDKVAECDEANTPVARETQIYSTIMLQISDNPEESFGVVAIDNPYHSIHKINEKEKELVKNFVGNMFEFLRQVKFILDEDDLLDEINTLFSLSEIAITESSLEDIAHNVAEVVPKVFTMINFLTIRTVKGYNNDLLKLIAFFPSDLEHKTFLEEENLMEIEFTKSLADKVFNNSKREYIIYDLNKGKSSIAAEKVRKKFGVRSSLSFGIEYHKRPFGFINFYTKNPYSFTEFELMWLRAVARQMGVAIRGVEEHRTLTRKKDGLQIINKGIENLNKGMKMDDFLKELADNMIKLFKVDVAHIVIVDTGNKKLSIKKTRPRSAKILQDIDEIPWGKGATGRAVDAKKTIVIPNVKKESEEDFIDFIGGIKSCMAVPLLSHNKDVIAAVALESYELDAFTSEDRDLANAMRTQLSVAIANAQNLQRLKNANRELDRKKEGLQIINKGIDYLNQGKNMDSFLEELADDMIKLFDIDVAHIVIVDVKNKKLFRKTTRPEDVNLSHQIFEIPWGEGLSCRAVRSKKTLVESDVQYLPKMDYIKYVDGIQSSMAVPLISHDNEVIAVVILESNEKDAFDIEDKDLADSMRTPLSVAIANAQNLQSLQKAKLDLEDAYKSLKKDLQFKEWGKGAGAMIHWLQGSMGSIKNNVSYAKECCPSHCKDHVEVHESLDAIKEKAESLMARKSDFSEPFKLENPISVVVSEVIKNAIENVKGCENIECVVKVDPSIKVLTEKKKLEKVFTYVIDNSIKAMKDCPKQVLQISSMVNDDIVTISISDTGVGISEEFNEKIYEVGWKTKGEDEGMGIGLWYCQMALKSMDGDIEHKSQVNQGTTVLISLPSAE